MTFDFVEISEALVAEHDCSDRPIFSARETLTFTEMPDDGGLVSSNSITQCYPTPNEFQTIIRDSSIVQVLLGPRGSTLENLERELNVVVLIRGTGGENTVTVQGTHYGCYAAQLVIRDLIENPSKYKKAELVLIAQEKKTITKQHDSSYTGIPDQVSKSVADLPTINNLRNEKDMTVSRKNHVEPPMHGLKEIPPNAANRCIKEATSDNDSLAEEKEVLEPPGIEYL